MEICKKGQKPEIIKMHVSPMFLQIVCLTMGTQKCQAPDTACKIWKFGKNEKKRKFLKCTCNPCSFKLCVSRWGHKNARLQIPLVKFGNLQKTTKNGNSSNARVTHVPSNCVSHDGDGKHRTLQIPLVKFGNLQKTTKNGNA